MNRLWVVEMMMGLKNGKPIWQPTVGCALTREAARIAWAQWTQENGGRRFRVREYRPYGDK